MADDDPMEGGGIVVGNSPRPPPVGAHSFDSSAPSFDSSPPPSFDSSESDGADEDDIYLPDDGAFREGASVGADDGADEDAFPEACDQ